ncbi:putative leucine-rich repeat-containing protein DDB_G0290503 isoform X2 [Euwallacea fornicatus]|uniref:putative leucine-rich repeat-containing protein DDB_G0290503 isoform X2 n=1 Tax=Euwallacea fornicatus TaxID=995702 RepID=UPI00338FB7A5
MNFVTNVFKKYMNKNDATQSNPSRTMEPPPKIEIIPPTPIECPLTERGGKSEDEEAFEDASEMGPTLSNKDTPMLDNSNSDHAQTDKDAVFIDGINEADDVHKSKIPQSNPTDPNIMVDSLKGLSSQLIQESETFKDTDNDIKNNAQPGPLSEIHCKSHQTLDQAPFKDHLKLDAHTPMINGSQDKPIQTGATVENIEKVLIQQDAVRQNEGLELKTPGITVEGQDLSDPMIQVKPEKITDKGEDSSKDKIDENQILIGGTLKVEEGATIECGITNSEPNTVTDQFKTQKNHFEKHNKQNVIEIADREEAQNYICMEDIVKVSKLDSVETCADIDSNKRYLERQDTKEFEKIEKQFQKEEVEIHKTDQGVAGSYIIEENEELLLDDLDKILDEELNRSNDLSYMRQDTREFERLEKQFTERSKSNNRQIEDILEQLVEESINNAAKNLENPNNLTDLVKVTPNQNIAASQGNLTDLSSETLTKQEHKSTEVEAAINSRPIGANEKIFRKETNGSEAAEKNFVQDKYQSEELLDVDVKVEETQPLKDGCELDKKKVDSSLKTMIHISQNEIETANTILNEDTMSELIPESTKINPEDEQVRSGSDNCRFLDKNSTSSQSNISILPEASTSGVKQENLVKEATKITNKLAKPLSVSPKKSVKNKVEVRPTFRNKQNSQIALESNSSEIDENEELKKKVISLQQELESLKNPKADNNLLSLSSEANLSGDILKYRKLLAEYEQQIALQAYELDKLKQESEKNMRHFTNTEMAFSDVFEKYEKAKVVISAYRRNEEVLLENIEMAEEQVIALENKCAVMKEQSMEQIRRAQEQVKYEKNKYKQEMAKLQAQVKRLEIKASSLELELNQKKEECQALAALCDDITGRTSN